MNSTQKNDWKLTQYALGEMDPRERAEFENSLSPEQRKELQDIEALSSQLTAELRQEPTPELSPAQRLKLVQKLAEPKPQRSRSFWVGWSLSPVAALLIGVFCYRLIYKEVTPTPDTQALNGPNPGTSLPSEIAPPTGPLVARDKSVDAGRAAPGEIRVEVPMLELAERKRNEERIAQARQHSQNNLALSQQTLNAQRTQAPLSEGFSGSGGSRALVAAPAKPMAKGKASPYSADSLHRRPSQPIGTLPVESEAEQPFNTESYDRIEDNPFKKVKDEPLSTFSSDVDTASYANLRRFLMQGTLPPKDAVRIEELVNYFPYGYAPPTDGKPFSVNIEVNEAPWAPAHRLVRVGIKGKEIAWKDRPATNLVFLLDTSGSMEAPNKLPLVKSSLKLLVDQMGANDRLAIVTYAGSAGLVLPSTSGKEKDKILSALDNLNAGGSTNGGEGINLAYATAKKAFRKGGVNRVILATDGDFNVGTTSQGELTRLIEEQAKTGVFLSVLGFGSGNLKDATMEKLADKGNGNYAYIDTQAEAKKALLEQVGGTLFTIAKDVKFQVEFNPAQVDSFRLIGYENRILQHQDFNDDTKDAGDIGAGHTVTALYEVVPYGKGTPAPGVDALKYQKAPAPPADASPELLTVKIRYKAPEGATSQLLSYPVTDTGAPLAKASTDFKFAAAVAGFGMVLRDSPHKGKATISTMEDLATGNLGNDPGGYRQQFLELMHRARGLKK